ncbi:hypothetical protein Tco_0432352 [Tanacetum coccineum]
MVALSASSGHFKRELPATEQQMIVDLSGSSSKLDKWNFHIDLVPGAAPGIARNQARHEEQLKIILEFVEERGVSKIESVKDWASPKTPTEIH